MRYITTLVLLLLVLMASNVAQAAFPVRQQTPENVVATTVSAGTMQNQQATVNNIAAPRTPEFESIRAKGHSDPGILSFILSIGALVLVGLGGITGWLLFPLVGLVVAAFAIYYGVKGFKRANKGFAIAGFVIGILVALSALGDLAN